MQKIIVVIIFIFTINIDFILHAIALAFPYDYIALLMKVTIFTQHYTMIIIVVLCT